MLTFVPLDDRPCTAGFPQRLAPLAGLHLALPPAGLLGRCTRFGDPDLLLDWLEQASPAVPVIMSTDMVLYGGLVASRAPSPDLGVLQQRARRTEQWLDARQDAASVDAFTILMRVPPYLTSEAERQASELLLAWSQAVARGRTVKRRALEALLPRDFRERYLATRARNAEINRRVLSWAEAGRVDHALVGMDDSRTEGLNVQERQRLEPTVASLAPRASLIPGADEVGLLLLARHALGGANQHPRICVRYSPQAFEHATTLYEDRPVGRLVEGHLAVLGLAPHPSPEDADVLLLVNGCTGRQREASVQLGPPRQSERHRALVAEAAAAMQQERLVAVADLAFANGADRGLVDALLRHVDVPSLAGFAAWNTAGNTVGTVLAHAVMRWLSLRHPAPRLAPLEATAAHVSFLLERLIDDCAYQSVTRTREVARCTVRGLNPLDLGASHLEVEQAVREGLASAAADLATAFVGRTVVGPHGTVFRIGSSPEVAITLPWGRLFEVDVLTRLPLAPA